MGRGYDPPSDSQNPPLAAAMTRLSDQQMPSPRPRTPQAGPPAVPSEEMGAADPRPVPPLPSALSVEGRGGVPCAPHTLGAGQPEDGAKQRVCLLPLEGGTHSCTCTRPSSRSGHRHAPTSTPAPPPLPFSFVRLAGCREGRRGDSWTLRQGPTVGGSGPPGSLARGAGSAPFLGATTLSPHQGGHLSPPCSPPLPVSPLPPRRAADRVRGVWAKHRSQQWLSAFLTGRWAARQGTAGP